MVPQRPFTLAELARAVGVSVEDARRFRELGLLQPPRRRRGRSADVAFHQEHVERLLFIKRALGYGFGIDEIARLVSPAALLTCGDVYELTAQRAEELRSSESTPPELAALEELMAACDGKGGRRDCSILAKLSECKASG